MTKSQVIAATYGGDYEDLVSELAREQEVAKEAGVMLDKDLGIQFETQQLELELGQEPSEPPKKRRRSKSS